MNQVRLSASTVLCLTLATCLALLCSCGEPPGDSELTAHTQVQLLDWHISGFWIINCPVAWVRVSNYNQVPIKNIVIEYTTYDAVGNQLDRDKYTIDGNVGPGQTKNFIELYFGLVNLYTEQMSIKLISAQRD